MVWLLVPSVCTLTMVLPSASAKKRYLNQFAGTLISQLIRTRVGRFDTHKRDEENKECSGGSDRYRI